MKPGTKLTVQKVIPEGACIPEIPVGTKARVAKPFPGKVVDGNLYVRFRATDLGYEYMEGRTFHYYFLPAEHFTERT